MSSSADPLPPAPGDLWTAYPRLRWTNPAERLADFPLALPEMAEMISRAIHLEMHGAGHAAGYVDRFPLESRSGPSRGELEAYSRTRAATASRLLAYYNLVYAELLPQGPGTVPGPGPVMEEATTSYRVGRRDGRDAAELGTEGLYAATDYSADAESFGDLPEAPGGLWRPFEALEPDAIPIAEQDYPLPLVEIASTLARVVDLEMRSAGEYAAQIPAAEEGPGLRRQALHFHLTARLESASRTLEVYETVHRQVPPVQRPALPTPERLRQATTVAFRLGLRDGQAAEERRLRRNPGQTGFNDALYEQLRRRNPGGGPGRRF